MSRVAPDRALTKTAGERRRRLGAQLAIASRVVSRVGSFWPALTSAKKMVPNRQEPVAAASVPNQRREDDEHDGRRQIDRPDSRRERQVASDQRDAGVVHVGLQDKRE